MAELLYKPSPWGLEYHSLDIEEVLGAGSAGPGKSMCLLMEPLQQIQAEHNRCADRKHPHSMEWNMSTGWALHLRRTRPMLETTLARAHRIFPSIDPKVRYDAERYIFRFSSGFRYQFGHCKDSSDWQQYLSNEYTIILFDELVQFEEEQYDQIITRLRSSDPVLSKMLKVRAMSNPMMNRGAEAFTVKDPFWVRKRFVEPARQGRVILWRNVIDPTTGAVLRRHRWMYFPATIDDNPDKAFVAQYKATLANSPYHIRQALLLGDWYVTVGSYFGDVWNQRIHVIRPFKIPDDWPRWRSMDWGFKNPGCIHWYAMDEDDNIYVEREITFRGKTDREVADRVKDVEEELGLWDERARRSRITGPADTQLWEERGGHGKTKAQVFLEAGVPWVAARKNIGISAHNAQRIFKRLGDHANGTRLPGLMFFSTCTEVIRTLPALQMDKNNEDPLSGGDDHWVDSLGYGIDYASNGRGKIGKPTEPKDDWADEDEPAKQMRGRYGYGSPLL